MNQNYNEFKQKVQKKKPWFLAPDINPPADYNPYKDEAVYPAEPKARINRAAFPWETPAAYEYRMQGELLTADIRKKERQKRFINGVFFPLLLALLMMNALASMVAMLEAVVPESVYILLNNILLVISYAAIFPVTFYLYSVGKRCKTHTFFKKPEASKFYIFRWTLISFGVTYAVATLSYYLFELFKMLGMHVNDLPVIPHNGALNTVIYFIAVVICAPIFEELLFRGFLLTGLSRYGAWFAIIVSGVTFGLYHQNHEQLFFATAFGILAGFVAMRTRSVIPTVIAHIVLNGYSFFSELFLSFTKHTGKTLLDPEFAIEGNAVIIAIIGLLDILCYILMILGPIMLIIEIAKNRTQFKFDADGSHMSKGQKTKLLLSSLAVILLLLIFLTNIIAVSFMDMDALLAEMNEMIEGYYQA